MTEDEYVEEYEEEEEYVEEYEEQKEPKKRIKLGETGRKILTFGIIIMVSFSLGCAVVGFSVLASENSARRDLKNNDLYLATITNSFSVTAYNETEDDFFNFKYIQDSNSSTFEDMLGEVDYIDNREDMEYMVISIAPAATEMSIRSITFHINEKSQLNIIIFADNKEVFNAMKIKKDITINFILFVTEISVYVF